MIYFSARIDPLPVEWATIAYKVYSVTKNKIFEWQLSRTNSLVGIGLNLNFRESHAGLELELSLFSFELELRFLDRRHWDYENSCWKKYDGSE